MKEIIRFFQQKITWLGLVIVIAAISIIGLAQIGSTSNPVPKNMPVAIVMNDQNISMPNGQMLSIGKQIAEKMTSQHGDETPVKWTVLNDKETAMDGLDQMKYYAVVLLPEQLSQNVASSLSPKPQKASVTVYINQGKNAAGANMVKQGIDGMTIKINDAIRTQLFSAIKAQGDRLNTAQAAALSEPITFNIENVNAVPTKSMNGNAPVALTILAWFGAIVASLSLYTASKKAMSEAKWGRSGVIFAQALMGAVYAMTSAVISLLLAKWLDLALPDAFTFITYFFIICYCFYCIQSALLNMLGLPAMPLLILVFFFGSPILTLPEEVLPSFTQDWLYSWIPLRFGAEVFRDIFYFGKELNLETPLTILIITAITALVLSVFSVLIKSNKVQVENEKM